MKSPFRTVLLAALSAILLYACGSSGSSASSGLSQSDVQAMITAAVTPLQQQIATLQGQVSTLQQSGSPAIFIRAPNAPAIAIKAQLRGTSSKATTTTTCTGLGTLTGRPDNSDPITSNNLSGVSCTGYYFTVSGAATASDTAIVQAPPSAVTIGFDAPNCTGNAYVIANFNGTSMSQTALANGAVITIGNPTVAANYWMLKPNTAVTTPNILSAFNSAPNYGGCFSWSGSLSAYALAPNDPTVSGVPSAPITGPVTIG